MKQRQKGTFVPLREILVPTKSESEVFATCLTTSSYRQTKDEIADNREDCAKWLSEVIAQVSLKKGLMVKDFVNEQHYRMHDTKAIRDGRRNIRAMIRRNLVVASQRKGIGKFSWTLSEDRRGEGQGLMRIETSIYLWV